MIREYFIWLLKFLTVIVVIFVGAPLILALVGSVLERGTDLKTSSDRIVGVVELTGEIFDVKEVVQRLHDQVKSSNITAVVLRIDSPGGAVGPSQEIYEAVKTLRQKKPIVASMGMVAASGGLYAALPASKIFANPGTMTGSIGVVGQFPNFTGLTEKAGVSMITVKSGSMKDIGNPFRPFTEEDRAYLQDMLKGVHQQFITAVAESRNMTVEKVSTFADGRVLTGEQALNLGLIDELGSVYEAAGEALALAGKPLAEGELPTLSYAEDQLSKIRRLLTETSRAIGQFIPSTQIRFVAF